MDGTARDEVVDGMSASNNEAASLVQSAMLLRWRAPELALLLADRAVAAAGDDPTTVLRADHLAAFALNRLGRHAGAAQRLLPPLQDADTPAELRHELQVELAYSAVALGEPATALAALRSVLAAGEDVTPVLRGTALVAAAESAGMLGRDEVVSATLDEAAELFSEDPHLDRDTVLLLRAAASAANAAHHRRSGAYLHAETLARAGRELLTGLGDPEHDSGQVGGRLVLEMVLALLDRGDLDGAVREAQPLLRRPVRAAAASAVGWLRLALATRVHLAEGRHEPALTLLADAVEMTQRHGVQGVLAECLEGLSHVHEVRGEFADALHCVRSARAAESRHRRMVEAARSALLEHCGPVRREIPGLVDQVAALLPATSGPHGASDPAGRPQAGPDQDPRPCADIGDGELAGQPLIDEELAGQPAIDEPVVPEPVVLGRMRPTLGARGSVNSVPPWVLADASVLLNSLGEHPSIGNATGGVAEPAAEELVAEAAEPGGEPETELVAEVAESDGEATEGPTAEDPAEEDPAGEDPVREEPAGEDPVGEEPAGVGPTAEDPAMANPLGDATGTLAGEAAEATAGEATGKLAGDPGMEPVVDVAEEPAPSTPAGTRRRRGSEGTPVLVSDLLPPSVLSSGRSGRRRAEDRPEEPPEDRPGETPAAGTGRVQDGTSGAEHSHGSADAPSPADLPAPVDRLVAVDGPVAVDGAEPQADPATPLAPPAPSPTAPEAQLNGSAAGQDGSHPLTPLELPVSGPPPPPPPRALDWVSHGSGGDSVSPEVSMGDLLAGALAAFQESGHPLAHGIDMTGPLTAADIGTSGDPTNQHGPQPRRAPGLQLAANSVDRDTGNAAEALTDPELRLPDLTAEPLWWPPGTGRRSTAGE